MGQFEELEKYKKLLDDGAISEEDFRKLKQKLLGLKSDNEKQLEREQALAEIEKLRIEKEQKEEQAKAQEKYEAEQKRIQEENVRIKEEQRIEKAKEKARLEALEEVNQQKIAKQKAEQKEKIDGIKSATKKVAKTVISWVFTVFFVLMALAMAISISDYGASGVVGMIASVLNVVLICPIIATKISAKVPIYSKIKIFVEVGLGILVLAMMSV